MCFEVYLIDVILSNDVFEIGPATDWDAMSSLSRSNLFIDSPGQLK